MSDKLARLQPEAAGFDQAETYARLKNIGVEHLRPQPIGPGETEIVLQRHGAYVREHGENAGSLKPESRDEQTLIGYHFTDDLLDMLPSDARSSLDVLVIASDTQYANTGRRSYETAAAVQSGIKMALEENGIGSDNVINSRQLLRGVEDELQVGSPRAEQALREPQMLDSADFRRYLAEQYGDLSPEFWQAFEEDTHADVRQDMGVEGPDDIADRALKFIDILRRYSAQYHKNHPGRRLLIWAATHYDVISPLVKLKLAQGTKSDVLGVDYGGGVVMKVDESGRTTSQIGQQQFEVPLFRDSE